MSDDVDRVILQRLTSKYLDPRRCNFWSIGGAEITGYRIGNRTGVPAGTTTIRYELLYPAGGWGTQFRAAWCRDDLVRPLGTHVVVERVHDLEDLHGEAGVRQHFRDWLRGLPL